LRFLSDKCIPQLLPWACAPRTASVLTSQMNNFCIIATASICSFSCAGAEQKDFYESVPVIYRELLYRLNDDDPAVLKADNRALAALAKHVPAEELVKNVEFIRNLINSMVSEARRRKGGVGDAEFLLPGFNMPKGTCILSDE